MFRMKRISILRCFKLFSWAIALSLALINAYAENVAPGGKTALEEVRLTVNDVVKIAESLSGENKTTERRAKLREVINPRFDFKEMAKRSLGAHWNNITPEEQQDFVDTFSDLLAKTYLSKIETAKSNMITVDSERVEFPKALVKTTVTHKGETFPLDYKLLNRTGEWKVYDVLIENVGLVENYRNEFAGIIRSKKFTGLMEKLRVKAKDS